MHKAHKWRKMRRMGGWPFVAAMMAEADCDERLGASARFGGPNWTFDFGPRGGGGRRRRRMFGSGELRLVLLKLVADEPRHGYELIKAIEELTEGAYAPSPGTIYPTLSLLEDEGAITQAAGDETRKAYEATDAGRSELEELPRDPWDTPYELLEGDTPNSFEIISCGPDKQPETEDDISSKSKREDG